MRAVLLFGAMAVLALMSTSAIAQWADDFDSYDTDISLHGVGGWKGWDNDPTWTAYTRDEVALSPPNAVEIVDTADLVHEYGYAGGLWTYTAMQYVPGNLSGITYFILQNMYSDGGPYNWSIQIAFNSATGLLTDDHTSDTLPIIYDAWTEIRVEIDLDTDWREVYYGDTLLGARTWTTGGDSLLEIGSVDLFANGATPVYYDDMSLVPEPASCLLLALGALVLRRR